METTAGRTAGESREVTGTAAVISVEVQEDSLVVMAEPAAVEVEVTAVAQGQGRHLSLQRMLQ